MACGKIAGVAGKQERRNEKRQQETKEDILLFPTFNEHSIIAIYLLDCFLQNDSKTTRFKSVLPQTS